MSNSHQIRKQHLSLLMYRARQGPPEVIEFIDGCLSGDLSKISKHIKKRRRKLGSTKVEIDLNAPVLENTHPLFLACQGKTKLHAAVVRHLIKKGAKTRDAQSGRLGLHRACAADAVEVAREWLGLMPNQISSKSFDGSTPLSLAAQCGSEGCINLLIKNGVDPDVRAVNNSTALFLACCTNNIEIVSILLMRGQADATIVNKDGETPLFRAAANGYLPIVQKLLAIPLPLSSIEAVVHSAAGQTALIAAARLGNVGIVVELLEAGADADHADSHGRTALYAAAQEGHLEVLQLLLNSDANLEPLTDNGSSPLSVSAQGGHLKIFEELLRVGADINIIDVANRSLFEIACIGGDYGVLNSLIKHGGSELKRWKVPVYLCRNARKADEVGQQKRTALLARHKEIQEDVQDHLRMCKVMMKEAILQCAKADEMAVKAGEFAEKARNGLPVGPAQEQKDC